MKILIIEDEKRFAQTLKNQLKLEYAVDLAFSAEEGKRLIKVYDYDLVILDIGLPDKDGISLCADFRACGIKSPVLMLTGEFAVDTKVRALDTGADDYLVKPFNIAELKARIRALLRRKANPYHPKTLTVGDLTVNVTDRTVRRGKKIIPLHRKEFQILEFFMRNPGKLITREKLIEHVWESGAEANANVIDVHIKYLRDQIDKPFAKKLIKTVYGLGYKLGV